MTGSDLLHTAYVSVAKAMGLDVSVPYAKNRTEQSAVSRWVAWKALRQTGLNDERIGRLAGYDRTTVGYGVRKIDVVIDCCNRWGELAKAGLLMACADLEQEVRRG